MKQGADIKVIEDITARLIVQDENEENEVDIEWLKHMRRETHYTIFDLSSILQVSSAEYSSFETERKAMPPALYRLALAHLTPIK